MSRSNWRLEIYEVVSASPVMTRDFDNLATLRVAIIESRAKKFVVRSPAQVTSADRNTLLDLRSQGFDISMQTS